MSHICTFTEVELYGLWALANSRNAKRPGVQSRKMYEGADDLITNYVGLKAEYAFTRLAELPINSQVNVVGGGDTAYIVHGRTVHIRASDDLLIFTDADAFTADVAVLVSPFGQDRDPFSGSHPRHFRRSVAIKGWVTREEFLAKCHTRQMPYGPRLCLRDGQLYPIEELLAAPVPPPVPQQLALV